MHAHIATDRFQWSASSENVFQFPMFFFNFQFGVNLKMLAIKKSQNGCRIKRLHRLLYGWCKFPLCEHRNLWSFAVVRSCWNFNYRTLIEKKSKWKLRVIFPLECINSTMKINIFAIETVTKNGRSEAIKKALFNW